MVGLLGGCADGPASPDAILADGSAAAVSTTAVTTATPTAPVTSAPVPSAPVPSPPASVTVTITEQSGPEVLPPVGLGGVNDPACTSDEPPVVLLPGTLSRIEADYRYLVPALRDVGRCVWGVDEPSLGLGPVRDAAARAATVVDEVRARTGATTVDVVGFSRGGLVLRTALRENGLAHAVGTAVLISPNFHGTTALVAAVPAALCPGCADQRAGSDLITALDAGGDLDGSVRYAVVVTSADAVVTPWESQLPAGPADRVRTVVVDERCPGLVVRHEDMARHPAVVAWTVAALQAEGAVDGSALPCP